MKKKTISLLCAFLFSCMAVQGQETSAGKKCQECHGKLAENKVIHPFVKDSCLKCHQPNGKEHPLEEVEGFTLVKEVPQLCYSCHKDYTLSSNVHMPVKSGTCFDCHEVHSSKEKDLLSMTQPDLCYFCHGKMEKEFKNSKTVHKAVTTGKACSNCHSPHASEEKLQLVANKKELCLSCHSKPIVTPERTIANIAPEYKNKVLHPPFKKCSSTCHNPHASSNDHLLSTFLSPDPYIAAAADSFALCWECHDPELFTTAQTTTVTNFRNGDKNLHYLHVNKEKGRNCINCHNAHSTNNPYLIADKARFGKWDMPIKYKDTPEGGSCSPGCHSEKTYTR